MSSEQVNHSFSSLLLSHLYGVNSPIEASDRDRDSKVLKLEYININLKPNANSQREFFP